MNLASDSTRQRARAILWIDSGAGGLVGLFILVLRDWLTRFYELPLELIVFIGVANLSYAAYSGTLAARASAGKWPSRRAIELLMAANLAWAVVCVGMVAVVHASASMFGLAHLFLEGLFVAGLAVLEGRLVRPITSAS